MKKWEYMSEEWSESPMGLKDETLIDHLNKLGIEGWELVSSKKETVRGEVWFRFLLKRELGKQG